MKQTYGSYKIILQRIYENGNEINIFHCYQTTHAWKIHRRSSTFDEDLLLGRLPHHLKLGSIVIHYFNINLFTTTLIYLFIHLLIYLLICLFTYLLVYLFICSRFIFCKIPNNSRNICWRSSFGTIAPSS